MSVAELPLVIQGGMGVGVSNWRLANAVSRTGQLGVVSGTGLDTVFVRRLQDGDPGGVMRRALEHLPLRDVADAVLRRYFRADGRAPGEPYRLLPMYKQAVSALRDQVTIAANFVEVFLAREGHDGIVGMNLLTKIQMPTLASLYGAMLAGVDVVLMGAGIPREIPGTLDALAEHRPASLRFDVVGASAGDPATLTFDPRVHGAHSVSLKRPQFLAIVSAHSLATTLARKANGRVDGFVVEGATAGGHNAPPRGPEQRNARGEPVYGARDLVDLDKLRELGTPFWLAGGTGSPQSLQAARSAGAAGVQVGTLFAFCEESGITPEIKARVLDAVSRGAVDIFTDPNASPTGFPFKLVMVDGLAQQDESRPRHCDLGYLRVAYRTPEGRIGYRCPAEPIDAYLRKGGALEDTHQRRCLCNGLMATIGLGQVDVAGAIELPLVTSGDALVTMRDFLRGRTSYVASDVIDYLLDAVPA